FSAELLADLERLTATATADKLARLAELLVKLAGRLQGQSALQVEGILEQWKARSPELKLRIYHLQQGTEIRGPVRARRSRTYHHTTSWRGWGGNAACSAMAAGAARHRLVISGRPGLLVGPPEQDQAQGTE
ncbi:MAG: hypothetical protein ABIL09_23325, partial [Gemmatimonadota bacterium]